MTHDDFTKALQLACDYEMAICIGGGEPTLHPLFKTFLMESIFACARSEDMSVDLTTNGSNTEISLTLAKLAKKGIISCALSTDKYHDPIDTEVVEAFMTDNLYGNFNKGDSRHTKNNNFYHVAVGRGALIEGGEKGCCCDSLFVAPSGMMYPCGCRKTKLGKVGEVQRLPGYLMMELCERSKEFKAEKSQYKD